MAELYLWVKWFHVLCAVVTLGTGGGIAFFMWMAVRSGSVGAMAVTARHVVLADWIFTLPAVIGQLLSGLWLMDALGYRRDAPWFLAVASMYTLVGLCWLPVLVLQQRIRSLAANAQPDGPVPPELVRWMRWWTALGIPAFVLMLCISYLMVFKPLAMR